MTTVKKIVDAIKRSHQKSGIPTLSNTSVVSPLFSGQFCYCLDEIHWYRKYGNYTDLEIGDDFQKIQPAIRLRDFEAYCLKQTENNQHLGLFSMATVTGGRVTSREDSRKYYAESVRGILDILSLIGLDLARLKVTYFSGNTAKEIEMSRKKENQERKILVDKYIPEDNFKEVLLECGLKAYQLEGVNTRDNYLTSNWHNMIVPWGYRNEFLYPLPNGSYLDIGTIERLDTKPIAEKINGNNCVIAIQKWDRNIVINGVGIERLLMAVEKADSISDISLLKPLKLAIPENKIREALRILHRVFTDVSWEGLGKHKDRKDHVKSLMRICNNLPISMIADFLHLHAEQYRIIFPDLANGIKRTVSEIENYRIRVK